MRYAKYILKLKNLYIFYTKYILPGLVDVLDVYLRYDNIGVGLPCLQRNFFSDQNAALIVGLGKALVSAALFTANTCISGCLRHQEGQRKYN